jgi:hypothetical protein
MPNLIHYPSPPNKLSSHTPLIPQVAAMPNLIHYPSPSNKLSSHTPLIPQVAAMPNLTSPITTRHTPHATHPEVAAIPGGAAGGERGGGALLALHRLPPQDAPPAGAGRGGGLREGGIVCVDVFVGVGEWVGKSTSVRWPPPPFPRRISCRKGDL